MTSFLLTCPYILTDVSLRNLYIFQLRLQEMSPVKMKVMVKVQKKVTLSYVKD